jgi:radical SAM superfamily enzyme YgiQ (UPF0313 family)
MICEPLELEYVAAGLGGHNVQIMDMILERGYEKRVAEFKPDIVGTSSYIAGVNEAIKVCRLAKRWNRNVKTVVGGVHASSVPEDYFDPAVDCIVLGDGTTVMPEVVKAIESGAPLDAVAGLVIPGPGGWHRTRERAYMPKPDMLPFPRRDLVAHLQHRYYYLFHQPVATMKTTWGCWYRCNFCFTWGITDGTPYSRSPESIVAELATIEAEDVYIVDDIFLINRKRLKRIAELLRERGIRKKYLVYGRSDFIAENEDVIAEWAALGLRAVFIGLEAATDPELDSMDKQATVNHNREAIAVLKRHGVDTYGSLITQPDYTDEDWRRLRRFIRDNGLYYLNISPLTPMPGTSIWKQYADRLTVSRRAHPLFDLSHVLLPTRVPLKRYYRSLLKTYLYASANPFRVHSLHLPTVPAIASFKFLRLWTGALKIGWQLASAHRHHLPDELARAQDRGPAVPGVTDVSIPETVREVSHAG